jgi:nitrogen fixation/metabolism regulation signal transduction histidine kinase
MTEESERAIPIGVHPDPVLAYAVREGRARVTETNGAFEATFERASVGSPVSAVFDRFEIAESAGGGDPHDHLLRGERAVVYLDGFGEGTTYLARVVPADGDDGGGGEGGFLVFAPLGDVLDLAETAGIEEVASVLSHDLRNPLDVATANLRAARETGEAEHFEAVAGAHDRMRTIIRDVLTLAGGRDAVDPTERIAIGSAVEDAWQSVETAGATLDVRDTLPTAFADADRLRRVFENLFRNAVEHGATSSRHSADGAAEHSGGAVEVRVGALDGGFYVADDGPGIPESEREAVFDPGYSSDAGGAGLGLAIVDRIVAAHGWEVEVTSADGGGARFEVRF